MKKLAALLLCSSMFLMSTQNVFAGCTLNKRSQQMNDRIAVGFSLYLKNKVSYEYLCEASKAYANKYGNIVEAAILSSNTPENATHEIYRWIFGTTKMREVADIAASAIGASAINRSGRKRIFKSLYKSFKLLRDMRGSKDLLRETLVRYVWYFRNR